MIKIIFSEVESPTTAEEAIDLNRSSGFRAINTSPAPAQVNITNPENGELKSITVCGGESIILKKSLTERVFCSTHTIRISGVSIY